MHEYKQYINGSLKASKSKDVIQVENPYTGKIISTVPNGGEADAKAALEAAGSAQDAWAARPAAERAAYLKLMAEAPGGAFSPRL